MAGSIYTTTRLKVSNGNSQQDIDPRQSTFVQDNVGGPTPGVIATSTSDTAIDLSELGTFGWCHLKNLDDTITIDWGPDSGGSMVPVGTLEPGESAMFRLKDGITLRCQAASGTPLLEVLAFED